MENVGEEPTTASTIGVGFVITPDNTVAIVIMLGDQISDDEHVSLATIALTPDVATLIVAKMQSLIDDAAIAEETAASMGHEAAAEYLNNWYKRSNAGLN